MFTVVSTSPALSRNGTGNQNSPLTRHAYFNFEFIIPITCMFISNISDKFFSFFSELLQSFYSHAKANVNTLRAVRADLSRRHPAGSVNKMTSGA